MEDVEVFRPAKYDKFVFKQHVQLSTPNASSLVHACLIIFFHGVPHRTVCHDWRIFYDIGWLI